jgi:hypothetical protein
MYCTRQWEATAPRHSQIKASLTAIIQRLGACAELLVLLQTNAPHVHCMLFEIIADVSSVGTEIEDR